MDATITLYLQLFTLRYTELSHGHNMNTYNVGMPAKKISLMMKRIGSIITATGAYSLAQTGQP